MSGESRSAIEWWLTSNVAIGIIVSVVLVPVVLMLDLGALLGGLVGVVGGGGIGLCRKWIAEKYLGKH